jgi:hypothetical protein
MWAGIIAIVRMAMMQIVPTIVSTVKLGEAPSHGASPLTESERGGTDCDFPRHEDSGDLSIPQTAQ